MKYPAFNVQCHTYSTYTHLAHCIMVHIKIHSIVDSSRLRYENPYYVPVVYTYYTKIFLESINRLINVLKDVFESCRKLQKTLTDNLDFF